MIIKEEKHDKDKNSFIMKYKYEIDSLKTELEIDSLDYTNIVKPNICVIAKELGIQTKICNDEYKTDDKRSEVPSDTTIGVDNSTSTKSGMPKWIKVLLWVVGIVVVWFVWLIAVFAIKAKMREDWESDDEE